MYKAVIFDLDGTLLDSLNDILEVLNKTLAHFNLPQITREQGRQFIGNGARELVRRALGEENEGRIDEIMPYFKEKYAQSDNGLSRIYDGEDEALKKLKAAGVKLAILTNKPHAAALHTQSIFFKSYCFDCVLGQKDGAPLKPDPAAVETVLKELNAKREDCVFVGDGEADILAAKNAGLDCISVLWGYRTEEQLTAAGAKVFVENYGQLTDRILK